MDDVLNALNEVNALHSQVQAFVNTSPLIVFSFPILEKPLNAGGELYFSASRRVPHVVNFSFT